MKHQHELERLDGVAFLQGARPAFAPKARHVNKLGKGLHKREQIKGGRPGLVATRLTAEQLGKLDGLVRASTQQAGVDSSRAAVLAELLDRA